MVTWRFCMKSLLMMLFLSIYGTSTYARELITLNSVKDNIMEQACSQAQAYRADTCNGKCTLSMGGMKPTFKSIINNLYITGAISLDGYNTAVSRLPQLDSMNFWKKSTRGKKKHIKEACGNGKSALSALIAGLSTPSCIKAFDYRSGEQPEMASAGQCCVDNTTIYDNYKLPIIGYQPDSQCKLQGNSCTEHSDCCSKNCIMNDEGTAGTCDIEKSCYIPNLEGQECPKVHPYCEQCAPERLSDGSPNPDYIEGCKTTTCLPVSHSSSGMQDFAREGASCSTNEDCSSDNCVNGKCEYKAVCSICTARGDYLETGDTCCPGLYPIKDSTGKLKCVTTLPPFTLPTNVKCEPQRMQKKPRTKTAIEVVLDLISYLNPIGNAYAQSTPTYNMNDGSMSSGSANGQECLGYGSDGLTKEQRGNWEECMKNANAIDGEGRQDMFAQCDREKIRYLEENRKAKGDNQTIGNGQNCDGGGQLTRNDYANLYDVPAITSKTFSDVKECEFNSFNDSWRSASNMERNAEITLRAFEAVYSGKGTVDYITEGGESIYERAQKVALKLREHRFELIKSFQELDQKMSCKCLAIFGPNNNWKFKNNTIVVNSIAGTNIIDKKEYFKEYCDGDINYAQEDNLREAEVGSGGDGLAKEKVDNSTTAQIDSESDKKVTEADRGSIGLSHEKLIVEWLGLKREVQMDRFKDNSDLEEELQNLTDFIQTYDWINNDGHYYNREGKAYLEPLYKYGVRRMAGWIAIVLAIVAVIAAVAFLPLAGVWLVAAAIGSGIAGFMIGGVLASLFEKGPTAPKIIDEKFDNKTTYKILGVPIYKAKYYHRRYRTEWFDNKHIDSDVLGTNKRCEVHSTNGSCVRSVYLINHKYSEDMDFQNYPLLDPVMPITAKSGDYKIEETADGKSYAKLLEEAYWNGIDALKATKPGTKKHCSEDHKDYDGSKIPCVKAGSSFTSYDPVNDKEVMKHFSIKSGQWVPEYFTEDKAKLFKKAIVKYAMCRKLAGKFKGERCVTMENMEEKPKAIGFGYLFEQEKDAKDFAQYAYEVHFIWPHLSADNKLGYPLLGQEAYFANILYNLKLVGSIALKRSLEAHGAYSLYKASWDRRKSEYAALTGSEDGDKSFNVGYPDEVYAQFEGLSFSNNVSMEQYSAKMKELAKSKDFDESSRGLFETASRAFERRSSDIKKRKEYDEKFGNSKRGKIKKRNIANFANKVNSPLQNMSLNVGRQNLGNVSGAVFGPDFNSKDTQNDKKGEEKKNTVASTPTYNFNTNNSSAFGSGSYGSYGSGSSSDDYSSSNKDDEAGKNGGYGGLSNTDLEHILRSAKKDESLYQADPDDSLFGVVSKAYKRNLSRILVLKSSAIRESTGADIDIEKPELSDKKKAKLKNLLDAN